MARWELNDDQVLAPTFGPEPAAPVDPAVQQRLSRVGGGQGANALAGSLASGVQMNQRYAQANGLQPSANPGPNEMAVWKMIMQQRLSPNSLPNRLAELQMQHTLELDKLRLQRDWTREDRDHAAKAHAARMRSIYGGSDPAGGGQAAGTRAQGPSTQPPPAGPSAGPGGVVYGADPNMGGFAELGGAPGIAQGPRTAPGAAPGPSGATPPAGPAAAPGGAPAAPQTRAPAQPSQPPAQTSAIDQQLAQIDRQIAREQTIMDRAVWAQEKVAVDAQKSKLTRLGQMRSELMDQRKAQSAGDKERERMEVERQFNIEKGARAFGGLTGLVDQLRNIPNQMRQTYGIGPDGKPTADAPRGTFNGHYGFDSTIGPELNMTLGPSSWGAPNIGGIPSWFANPGNSYNETRAAIQGKDRAIGLMMKGIVREKGEGEWTDKDQDLVSSLLGNLLEADDEGEYNRRLDNFEETLKSILQSKGVPPEAIEQVMRQRAEAATQARPGEQSQGQAAAQPTSGAAQVVSTGLQRYDSIVASDPANKAAHDARFKAKFGMTPDEARVRINGEPQPESPLGGDMTRTTEQAMTPGPQEERSMAMALRRYDEMMARNPAQKAELDRKFRDRFGVSPDQARTGASAAERPGGQLPRRRAENPTLPAPDRR